VSRVRLAGEVIAAYVVVRWQLRRCDFPGALAAIRHAPVARAPEDPHRLAGAVSRALALLPSDGRCLLRSLVLLRLLARRGDGGRLVLGVRPGERFAAHAWVERDGVALLPTGAGTFERLAEL